MFPQPMMPISILAMAFLSSHTADESIAGARARGRIGGLVMLDHHPLCTGRAGGPPQVAPVQDPGTDVRPTVLVRVLPRWRDVFYVRGDDAVTVAFHPALGIGAAPNQPGEIHLPSQRAVPGGLKDQLQSGLGSFPRDEFPVVVVVPERDALSTQALG